MRRLEDRFPEGETVGFPINLTMGRSAELIA
jgi:hypothetical protein